MLNSLKNKLNYLKTRSLKNPNTPPTVLSTPLPSRISENNQQATLNYCINIVRKHDYEGYLTTLLVPDPKTRRALFAVKAFNAEVATIRGNVSFKETGLSRLRFWQDAVDHLFGKSKHLPRHPVIQELAREVVSDGALSKRWFMNLVDSRHETMTDSPFKTMEDLEKYCEKSVSPIFYITFNSLGLKAKHLDHAASHFGKTIGITNFIRSLPHDSKQRRVLVPQDLLLKHDISQESFMRCDQPEKISNVVYDLASCAVAHYKHGKSLKSYVSIEALQLDAHSPSPDSVFMASLPSKIYLERLQKNGFNPYDPYLTRRYGFLPWILLYNKLRKRYY